jgi:hypothetical protein
MPVNWMTADKRAPFAQRLKYSSAGCAARSSSRWRPRQEIFDVEIIHILAWHAP